MQRQPATLADLALLPIANATNNLFEFMAKCSSLNSNQCVEAPETWKKILVKFLGPLIVAQRGDLTGRDWYDFAKFLVQGITLKYSIIIDANDNIHELKPVPTYAVSNVSVVDPLGLHMYTINFHIPGAAPRQGTRGYFVEINEDGGGDSQTVYVRLQEKTFFVHLNPDIALANARIYVAEKYYANLLKNDYYDDHSVPYPWPRVRINRPVIFLDIDYPTLPEKEFFIEHAKQIQPNSTESWIGTFWTSNGREARERRNLDGLGIVEWGSECNITISDIMF